MEDMVVIIGVGWRMGKVGDVGSFGSGCSILGPNGFAGSSFSAMKG